MPDISQDRGLGGIVFYGTKDLEAMRRFYEGEVGCRLWLDQGACLIFQHGNMLLGFCRGDRVDRDGIITFFYTRRDQVDRAYEKFEAIATSKPVENNRFRIYHFFAQDPEQRTLEFQYFAHPLPPL